jgi:hypothetical protein
MTISLNITTPPHPVFDRDKSGYIVEFHNGVDIVVLMSRRLDHSATLLIAKMQKERRE